MTPLPKRIAPGPGQESVWDYPRPPRIEDVPERIRIVFNGVLIADTTRAKRVLETSHPPVYYIPPMDVQLKYLRPNGGTSFCEWKGRASYFTVEVMGKIVEQAAWSFPTPDEGFEEIANYLAFYAGPMDACYVGHELVRPQPGGFYGGWVTRRITGPFKGDPGTWDW